MIQGLYDAPNKFVANGFNVYRYLSLFANPYEAIKTPAGNYTQAGMLTFGQLEKGGRSLQKDQLLKNTLGFQTSFLNNALRINGDYTVFVTQNRYDIQNIRLKYENKPGSITSYSNQEAIEINIENLRGGQYLLKLSAAEGLITKRFIKR